MEELVCDSVKGNKKARLGYRRLQVHQAGEQQGGQVLWGRGCQGP